MAAPFREHRPPTRGVRGKNDQVLVAAGADPYRRDNPDAEAPLLDTGRFALDTRGPQIAGLIRGVLDRKVRRATRVATVGTRRAVPATDAAFRASMVARHLGPPGPC